MSAEDAGWLVAGGTLMAGVTALIKSLKASPDKQLETRVEEKRLELTADEQEAQQAERAVVALMELLRETRSMLREEREIRREWQQSAEALRDSNEALRNEVASLRAEVAKLSADVHITAALRKELEETRAILATYRAKEQQQ